MSRVATRRPPLPFLLLRLSRQRSFPPSCISFHNHETIETVTDLPEPLFSSSSSADSPFLLAEKQPELIVKSHQSNPSTAPLLPQNGQHNRILLPAYPFLSFQQLQRGGRGPNRDLWDILLIVVDEVLG